MNMTLTLSDWEDDFEVESQEESVGMRLSLDNWYDEFVRVSRKEMSK